MTSENLTRAVEDYLKVIYELMTLHGLVSTNQIAEEMNVKPASVTGMIQKLAAFTPPLVVYKKHHGVTLTTEGEMAALEVIRHHRLLERFLFEIMEFPLEKVHEEAHRLEHVISDEFEERMADMLGNPSYDPHGDPIPNQDLTMPPFATKRLSDLRPGQRAIVKRIPDTVPELLRYLEKVGLVLKAHLEIIDYSPFDNNLKLKVSGDCETIVLGSEISAKIYVELIP
jgi:DtxR family Mn-dependent transcriptional regulator